MSRPFNNAKYQALLKGLEISVIRKSELEQTQTLRFDAEHYRSRYYSAQAFLTKTGATCFLKMDDLLVDLTNGHTPLRHDLTVGDIPFLCAEHVNDFEINFDSQKRILNEHHKGELARTALRNGDILMTIKGRTGNTAIVENAPDALNINQDVALLRLNCKLPVWYVVAYLNSSFGRLQVERQCTGAINPFLSLSSLRTIEIPVFAEALMLGIGNEVKSCVQQVDALLKESLENLTTAEQTLLDALGLADWQPPDPLTYTCSSQAVLAAERFDSQYFAPRVAQLLSRLGGDGRTIRDVAPPRTVKFKPGKDSTFRYIEIGDVQSNGTVTDSELKTDSAPSRATWLVKAGDVLTSTVRPNRRLSALVTTEQNGCVASSGFVVLKPVNITPEVLLTYLRLPVFCELMDLHTSASLYPAISADDLLSLPIPNIPSQVSETITGLVRSAHTLRRNFQALLQRAKHAVELAIEEGEA